MHFYDEDNEDDADETWASQRAGSAGENPDGADLEQGDDVKCVHCGRYIHEQADMCPYCKMWQSDPEVPARKPLWFVVTAIVTLLAFSGVLAVALVTCGGSHG
jgi:hypothetical protein